MAAPRKYPDEFRVRAMRLANDLIEGSDVSMNAACRQVGAQLGITGRHGAELGPVSPGWMPGSCRARAPLMPPGSMGVGAGDP